MTDDDILDVIATELRKGLYSAPEAARDIFAALRNAGYDIVPTEIAKLGRAAEIIAYDRHRTGLRDVLDIYAEAGVERP